MQTLNKKKSINFVSLYKIFRWDVIEHFLLSIIVTFLLNVLNKTVQNIISFIRENRDAVENISPPFPKGFEWAKDIFGESSKGFFIFGLSLVLFLSILKYLENTKENEIRIKSGHYIKNLVLEKFRNLDFHNKITKKAELDTLAEMDSEEIGYSWEHIPNHTFHNILSLFLVIFFNWKEIILMKTRHLAFSFFIVFLINFLSFVFTKMITKNRMKYREEYNKEISAINKEKNNIILIESSGLIPDYKKKQTSVARKNKNLLLKFNKIVSLNRVSQFSLINSFPFFLVVSGKISDGKLLMPFWNILESFKEILHCFWDYADYAASVNRVNRFLSLGEKERSLGDKCLKKDEIIQQIDFNNVWFRYEEGQDWIMKNYSCSFKPDKINYLLGKNGTGKSTTFYLILGILLPQKGTIVLTTDKGVYNLRDLNLDHWRENNVAYCSHQTLFDEGSTGQKQIKNIETLFKRKKDAQVWLFDESDNALDDENKKKFTDRLDNFFKNKDKKKLIIRINH